MSASAACRQDGAPEMTNPTAAALIARSNRLGADPKNTNYAGGNTSAKGTEIDAHHWRLVLGGEGIWRSRPEG